MRGRHRIDLARRSHGLTGHRVGRGRVRGDEKHRAGALAIQAEILRAGGRHDAFGHHRTQQAQALGILVDTIAKALVSGIDEWREAVFQRQAGDRAPLIQIEIRAGGVMTAAVQQHDVTGTHAGKRAHHRIEIDGAARGVVVGILQYLQPGATDQRNMIGPGRSADPDPGIGACATDEFRADPQGAAAAWRLHAAAAVLHKHRVSLAEQQRAHALVVEWIAGDALVGLGGFGAKQLRFGLVHRAHDRRTTRFVLVDADPEVDLASTRILAEFRHETQNRIRREQAKILEHGNSLQKQGSAFSQPGIARIGYCRTR